MRSLLWIMLTAWSSLGQAATTELIFDVYLDDDSIGFHRVSIQEMPGERRVQVEAEMEVDFLFFTAFSYRHRADERWRGDCVFGLETRTDDDGERLRVDAGPVGDALEVVTPSERKRLDGCVRTFAYWKPELLASDYLLNTQNGAYEPARLVELAPEPLRFNGRQYGAKRYRLEVGEEVRIDLWYDEDDGWQALQTEVVDGRVLNYVRREG
jgi:hypothetical protein